MGNQKKEKKKTQKEINRENMQEGIQLIRYHPIFGALQGVIRCKDSSSMGKNTLCFISPDAVSYTHLRGNEMLLLCGIVHLFPLQKL